MNIYFLVMKHEACFVEHNIQWRNYRPRRPRNAGGPGGLGGPEGALQRCYKTSTNIRKNPLAAGAAPQTPPKYHFKHSNVLIYTGRRLSI
jgi:hypothetical protein